MFDRFHLTHFEIKTPIYDDTSVGIVTTPDAHDTEETSKYHFTEYNKSSESLQNARYCLNGSVDLLLTLFPLESDAEPLYMQSLTVLDNQSGFFFDRSDYTSLLISYTYAGEGRLDYEGESYTVTSGQLFIIDCRKPHVYRADSNWQHIDINLWGRDAEPIIDHFEKQEVVVTDYPIRDYNVLIERLLDACVFFSPNRHAYVSNALSNILWTALESAEKAGQSQIPSIFKYVIRYIENNYTHPVSLDELARFANISKYHFSREFKKYTGYSPNEYIISLRMKHACILLKSSDLSIEQISEEVGVNNMSNFIRQFKKRTGMNPSDFRKYK